MRNHLNLADQQTEFLTRSHGLQVRERIEEVLGAMSEGDCLVIDFTDVAVMTPSFADECFGKLAEAMGSDAFRARVKLTGADDTNRSLVNAVLHDRLTVKPAVAEP